MEWDDTQTPPRMKPVTPTPVKGRDLTPRPNVAQEAKVTVSNEPVPTQYWVKALNDELVRSNPLPPDMWGTWTGNARSPLTLSLHLFQENVRYDKVGEGRMTITDSQAPKSVTIRLEFLKPFAATNTTQFDLVPSGSGTSVTWAMTGRNNFVAKAMCVFMDMDKMVGPDFEAGLANLKVMAERR